MVEYDKIIDSDDPVEEIENWAGEGGFAEWRRLVAEAYRSGKLSKGQRIELFGMPVEGYCTDPDSVEVLGTVEPRDNTEEQIRAEVDHVVSNSNVDKSDVAVGVHVTTMENANQILDEGINPYYAKGPDEETTRDRSTFFWVHSTDVGARRYDHPDGVITASPIEKTKVSSFMNFEMLAGGYVTPEEYDSHHVFSYREYVDAVSDGHFPANSHTPDTIL